MKHYKIIKKTFYSLEKDGELHSESLYKPYVKRWFGWTQLSNQTMFSDGSTSSIGSDVAFKHLENCEKFIHAYHKYYNKINTYTIETVKKIDLE